MSALEPGTVLLTSLARVGDLLGDDRRAIIDLPWTLKSVSSREVLLREGEGSGNCVLLVDGYASCNKVASNGARQIVAFHSRGDIVNLSVLAGLLLDYSVSAVTPAVVATVPTKIIMKQIIDRHNVREALWRLSLIDAAIYREWVLNVGRRDAKMRVAHMLCEFAHRADLAGLGPGERFEMPMTQDQIADATGLTPVHVSRMLAELERDGAISRSRRLMQIKDWQLMRRLGDFHARYLHDHGR